MFANPRQLILVLGCICDHTLNVLIAGMYVSSAEAAVDENLARSSIVCCCFERAYPTIVLWIWREVQIVRVKVESWPIEVHVLKQKPIPAMSARNVVGQMHSLWLWIPQILPRLH